jgi:hypothetical protein
VTKTCGLRDVGGQTAAASGSIDYDSSIHADVSQGAARPYAHLRHPIYTGLILAMLGSAIRVNIFWAVLLIPVGAYFI